MTVFVDSVNGNDGNSGETVGAALQTLAGVSWADGLRVALVAGSEWLEELSQPIFSLTIIEAGSGTIPIISGADTVSSWTAHATESNVWEASVTHNSDGSNRLTVYEDDTLLERVADAATCSSTPGSFVDIKGSDGATLTVRIHTSDSGNPNSNGKTYEVSKRHVAVYAGDDTTILGPLRCKRAISASGSVIAGANSTVLKVLSEDGTKHNIFIGSGSFIDSIAYANDPPTSYEMSNTFFVAYRDNTDGHSVLVDRCGAIQPTGNGNGGTFMTAHDASGTSYYDAVTLRQCWALGAMTFDHPGGVETVADALMEGCYSKSNTPGIGYGLCRYGMAYDIAANGTSGIAGSGAATVEDFAGYFEERTSEGNFSPVFVYAGDTELTRCAFAMGGAVGYTDLFSISSATGPLVINNSIIFGFGSGPRVPSGAIYAADYNIFFINNSNLLDTFVGYYAGNQYTSLSTWQAATTQDTNSVIVKAADQVAGGANALFYAYAQAEAGTDLTTIGPAVGDFRLNPVARVYDSADNAYIGTFADGTKLFSSVGPQTHWDWDAWATASGPPSAFPDVPETLTEAREYVAAPEDWAAYAVPAAPTVDAGTLVPDRQMRPLRGYRKRPRRN